MINQDKKEESEERHNIVRSLFVEEIDAYTEDYRKQNGGGTEWGIVRSRNDVISSITQFCENFASPKKMAFEEAAKKVKQEKLYPNAGVNRRLF